MKYLQTSKYCPMCNTKIHETQPLLNLKLDRVMQDIVYKLVPGLQESEWGGGAAGCPGRGSTHPKWRCGQGTRCCPSDAPQGGGREQSREDRTWPRRCLSPALRPPLVAPGVGARFVLGGAEPWGRELGPAPSGVPRARL